MNAPEPNDGGLPRPDAGGGEARSDAEPRGKAEAGSETEWRERLTPQQYWVTRQKGTEPPFTGEYLHAKTAGTYACVCCGHPLFHSEHKYDSGSGWPSFWRPLTEESVRAEFDGSHGLRRTEVLCRRCDAHLGHVFEDGPEPTGLRYCINSVALDLRPEEEE